MFEIMILSYDEPQLETVDRLNRDDLFRRPEFTVYAPCFGLTLVRRPDSGRLEAVCGTGRGWGRAQTELFEAFLLHIGAYVTAAEMSSLTDNPSYLASPNNYTRAVQRLRAAIGDVGPKWSMLLTAPFRPLAYGFADWLTAAWITRV